jgi:hypothetical protein
MVDFMLQKNKNLLLIHRMSKWKFISQSEISTFYHGIVAKLLLLVLLLLQ